MKTRLGPPLSPAVAARLYRCFLLDVLDGVRALGEITPVIAHAPRRARGLVAAMQPGTLLLPQVGTDLGARMAGVFECSAPIARPCRPATCAPPSGPCAALPSTASSGRATTAATP